MTIIDAMSDENLFSRYFQGPTWTAWKVLLKVLFGISLTKEDKKIYKKATGRTKAPKIVKEFWAIVGRRGGKSRIAALIATWLAIFVDHSEYITPGERGVVMVIAENRKQAKIALRYIRAFIAETPLLANMIVGEASDRIDLDNNISIEVQTANFRSVRGHTIVAAICDEIAFWRSDESANPDEEIINAITPGMATIPSALLIAISSPYSKDGILYKTFKEHYGKEGEVLVWKTDTRTMNPAVPEAYIKKQYLRDKVKAAAEYGAEFREDIESLFDRDVVLASIDNGVLIRGYIDERFYVAFVDPSGGAGDSFTAAVAHAENGLYVLDYATEFKPPFSPEQVITQISEDLRRYQLSVVFGDRYAGLFPREQFGNKGLDYEVTQLNKSQIYVAFLSHINSGKVRLLDNKLMFTQFMGLDRHTTRYGKDWIEHKKNAHDDLANAVAGAIVLAAENVGDIGVTLTDDGLTVEERLEKEGVTEFVFA